MEKAEFGGFLLRLMGISECRYLASLYLPRRTKKVLGISFISLPFWLSVFWFPVVTSLLRLILLYLTLSTRAFSRSASRSEEKSFGPFTRFVVATARRMLTMSFRT